MEPTWKLNGSFIEDESGAPIAMILTSNDNPKHNEVVALLLAAPDLFDALENLYADSQQRGSIQCCEYCYGEALKADKGQVAGPIQHHAHCSLREAKQLLTILE